MTESTLGAGKGSRWSCKPPVHSRPEARYVPGETDEEVLERVGDARHKLDRLDNTKVFLEERESERAWRPIPPYILQDGRGGGRDGGSIVRLAVPEEPAKRDHMYEVRVFRLYPARTRAAAPAGS